MDGTTKSTTQPFGHDLKNQWNSESTLDRMIGHLYENRQPQKLHQPSRSTIYKKHHKEIPSRSNCGKQTSIIACGVYPNGTDGISVLSV